jgi:hypothetical protein
LQFSSTGHTLISSKTALLLRKMGKFFQSKILLMTKHFHHKKKPLCTQHGSHGSPSVNFAFPLLVQNNWIWWFSCSDSWYKSAHCASCLQLHLQLGLLRNWGYCSSQKMLASEIYMQINCWKWDIPEINCMQQSPILAKSNCYLCFVFKKSWAQFWRIKGFSTCTAALHKNDPILNTMGATDTIVIFLLLSLCSKGNCTFLWHGCFVTEALDLLQW